MEGLAGTPPTHPPPDSTVLDDGPPNSQVPARSGGYNPLRNKNPDRHERLRVRAFEMFCEGAGMTEIAQTLDCTRQYLYKVSRAEDWVARRTHLKLSALLTEGSAAKALEMATAHLQSKIEQRLSELDRLCVKHNLKAIITWLEMAGVGKKVEIVGVPREVGVYNDLSDRRQVTVVQEGPKQVEEAP